MQTPLLTLKDISFGWVAGQAVLDVPRFDVTAGERVFLEGASGSGKSTLLNIICGVFEPSSGEANVLGEAFDALSPAARDKIRADQMGVIFQQFNLVPFLSLIENVLLPCRFSASRANRVGANEQERKNRAVALLSRLGLSAEAKSNRNVQALSVGQQQRVAAARALIGDPKLIIADEPTSALDHATRNNFINTLLEEASNATVIFVSHDPTLASAFDRTIRMADINRAIAPSNALPGDASGGMPGGEATS